MRVGRKTGEPADRSLKRGFSYLVLLWWVSINGVMLAALGKQWQLESRRQAEAEMVFRAAQIREALTSYQLNTPKVLESGAAMDLPRDLADLLEDKRGPHTKRHLRRLWPDPITGDSWGLVMSNGRVRGVFSRSERAPLGAPEGVRAYHEWRFEVHEQFDPAVTAPPPTLGQNP